MPWFITAATRIKEMTPMQLRCFGFYETCDEAFNAVEENRGNMRECLYDYLVIELIEQGIHPEVLVEYWFKWDSEYCHPDMSHGRWLKCEKPEEFNGIVNFALG